MELAVKRIYIKRVIKTRSASLLSFFIVFTLLPFFKPIGPAYYSSINSIYQIWKLIDLGVIAIFLLRNFRKISINSSVIFYGAFWIIYLANSLNKGIDWFDLANNFISITMLTLYISIMFNGMYRKIFLKAVIKMFIVFIIIQLLSMVFITITKIELFEPIKDDYVYFFGTDNYSAFATLTMISLLFVIKAFTERRKVLKFSSCPFYYVLLLLLTVCYLVAHSVTASLAHLLLFIFLFFHSKLKKISGKYNVATMFIFILLFTILVVYVKIQKYLSVLLVSIFNKDLTFNSRYFIWDRSYTLFFKNPVFGNGEIDLTRDLYILYGANHAHNFVLELLLKTGVIGTILYYLYLIKMLRIKQCKKYKKNFIYIPLIAFSILFLMDFYIINVYFYFFAAMCGGLVRIYGKS